MRRYVTLSYMLYILCEHLYALYLRVHWLTILYPVSYRRIAQVSTHTVLQDGMAIPVRLNYDIYI